MAKFGKKSKTSQDIPTAALPDIIFMLLFFFMVTTVMRETDILVKQILPKAIQLSKLERKSLVSYIYIGEPKQSSIFGKEPKIQVNDVFVEIDEIVLFVNQEKDKLNEFPNLMAKFSNILFFLVFLFSILIAIYALYKIYYTIKY